MSRPEYVFHFRGMVFIISGLRFDFQRFINYVDFITSSEKLNYDYFGRLLKESVTIY